jgi:hypothetical protein
MKHAKNTESSKEWNVGKAVSRKGERGAEKHFKRSNQTSP